MCDITVFLAGIAGVIIAIGISFVRGTLIQLTSTLLSILYNPLLVLFILGATFPFVSSRAILPGIIISSIFIGFLSVGGIVTESHLSILKTRTDNCVNFSSTSTVSTEKELNASRSVFAEFVVKYLFGISYIWYAPIQCLSSITITLILSIFPGKKDYCFSPKNA